MGVALVPSSATFRTPPGVRVRPLTSPTAAWDIGLAWSAARADEPALRAFLDVATKAGHAIRPGR
jgi:DNA-binding transcriptional LysR family regulator